MPQFINTSPDEALGYPAYFRAMYARGGGLDSDAQFQAVVASIADHFATTDDSAWAVPINTPTVQAGDAVCVLDFRVSEGSALQAVGTFAALLEPGLPWLPKFFRTAVFASLARVSESDVYGNGASRDNARIAGNADPSFASILTQAEHTLVLAIGAVLILLVVIVAAPHVARALKGRSS